MSVKLGTKERKGRFSTSGVFAHDGKIAPFIRMGLGRLFRDQKITM